MKHLKILLYLLISIACLWSCKYDDEDLWNKINSLEERIASLEEMLSNMNKDISSISTIVNALQDNITVTNIEQKENSYTITFSNDKKITITNGKDGEDGKDAPIIGIDIFEGSYFWTQTIQGVKTWLTDSNGDKIPVTGEGGITPRLKISTTGYWMVSYDNGISYTQIVDEKGKPVLAVGKDGTDGEDGKDGIDGSDGEDGKDGDSFFKEVKVEGNELVLILKDGTTLRIPYSNGGDTNIQTATIKGSVELESTEGISVLSLVGESKLSQEQFSVDVISNNLPQLLFVTDETDNVIMMARGYFQEKSAEINVQSTALALVSVMPQLVVKTKDDFDELSQMILQSTHFNKVKEEVEKCIKAKKDILDTNNTDLFQNIKALINDLMGKNQTRAFEHIAGIETSPLDVQAQGNTVAIRNIDLYPPYECKVTYGGKQIADEIIHTPGSFGILDLLKGELGKNHYGISTDFSLIYQGEYNFYCDKCTLDARCQLVAAMFSDVFSMIGFDENDLKKFKELKLWIEATTKIASSITSMYAGTLSIEDIIYPVIDSVCSMLSGMVGEHEVKIPLIEKAEKVTVKTIQKVYNVGKGLSLIAIRATEALKALSPITFNLCYYSEITCCTNVTLTKVEKSDNQTGEPEGQLENPIEVLVTSTAEDGTPILNDYHKVKFEVISGNGSVANLIADIDENGFAKTTWILGESGIQQVRAVVINSITNTENSEPVIFTATAKEKEDDRQTLIALYNATGGTNWNNNTNWCTNAPLNEWYGVEVNQQGRVIGLTFDELGQYGEGGNNLRGDADFSKLTELITLKCNDNHLTSINVSGLKKLENLYCGNNELTSLNVSELNNLIFLEFANNQISTMEIASLKKLHTIRCDYNKLTSLILSDLPSLEILVCPFNPLQKLDVSELQNLQLLRCENLQLTNLDVSKLTKLNQLECQNNNITNLNISNCKNLTYFMCNNNQISKLDASQSENLDRLFCDENKIESLTLPKNSVLKNLSCSDNLLSILDLSKSTQLEYLNCSNNSFSNLNIYGLNNLNTVFCSGNKIKLVYLSTMPEHFNCDLTGEHDWSKYPEPNHKEGYQYPQFIYQ